MGNRAGSHVFTYGSLMFAPVWQQVVRGSYRSAPATLADYRRHALHGETYPGMVVAPGARVEGLVYFDVSAADVARLDAFEGDQYRRVAVQLQLAEGPDAACDAAGAGAGAEAGATRLPAQGYLFTDMERLSPAAWDPAAFALERFMASYCRDKAGD